MSVAGKEKSEKCAKVSLFVLSSYLYNAEAFERETAGLLGCSKGVCARAASRGSLTGAQRETLHSHSHIYMFYYIAIMMSTTPPPQRILLSYSTRGSVPRECTILRAANEQI